MLKIKASVTLKELEKFGFKHEEIYDQWYFTKVGSIFPNVLIQQDREVKHIGKWNKDIDFALIEADLVEKVENDWFRILWVFRK